MFFDSIVKTAMERYCELLKEFFGTVQEWKTLDDGMERLQKLLGTLGVHLLELTVQQMSDLFFASEERRESGLRVKQRGRKRRLYTPFGTAELANDIYENPHANAAEGERRCFSPVLEHLGLTPHQKVADAVQRELMINALDMSYAKSAVRVGDGTLSRQTACRYVTGAQPIQAFEVPDELRRVKILHVFIDEEHIALQKDPAGRKSTIVPCGAIAEGLIKEGKRPDCKGRRRLLNPTFFTASDLKSRTLVDEMQAFIETVYDLSVLEKVVVHGDGAAWINKAFDDAFPVVVHAYDGFHLQRELRHFAGRFTETKRDRNKLRGRLEKALEAKDKDLFTAIVDECIDSAQDEKVREKSREFHTFFMKNWGAATARFDKDEVVIGSCTESIVQHLCACRTSSIPCSWSRRGAAVICSWRAAQLNGVDLRHLKPCEMQANGYTRYMDEVTEQFSTGSFNWDIFEPAQYAFDLNSGTQHLMSLIAAGGGLKAM